MNVIGIYVPKIITILTVWIPAYDWKVKAVLSGIWFLKLLLDHDTARSCASLLRKLVQNMGFKTGNAVLGAANLLLAVSFEVAAILFGAYIPAVPGGIAILFVLLDLFRS